MRQKPDLSEDAILACLRTQYDLDVVSARFLPIGYDVNAFVYEAITADGVSYFVKIRAGTIHPPSLLVPRLLIEHNIPHILAPLRTKTQTLWGSLGTYSIIVYPFIRGADAQITGLSDSQWREFGATLNAIHSGGFAAQLQGQVPAETFAIPSAQLVRRVSDQIQDARFESAEATRLVAFWQENISLIQHLLARAETLGKQLQTRAFEHVLCHTDIHAANIMVSESGSIYLIDWDGPLLAPRERDLLFIIGSRIARPVLPEEEKLFFEGYGEVGIDLTALAYYRYERAIEDIGETGRSVFWDTHLSEEVKADDVEIFMSQFRPGEIIESAMEADRNQDGDTRTPTSSRCLRRSAGS